MEVVHPQVAGIDVHKKVTWWRSGFPDRGLVVIRPELGQFSAYLNAGGCGQALRGGGRAGDLRR
jgi:hypothetical protein